MLLKNSARDSRNGDKLKPRWKGPYKVHADLGKGVYTLCNEKTGKVLKKAVNISWLTEFHPTSHVYLHHLHPFSKQNCLPISVDAYAPPLKSSPAASVSKNVNVKSPKENCSPIDFDNCPKSPEKIEQSPVSLSIDLSPEINFDCLPVVDDCASSPEMNEQSPASLSADIDAHSHMPLHDDADCSPILIDDCVPSAENVCKFWMSGFQLYRSNENDLLVGNELSDAVINAAQHLLMQSFTTINGLQSPTLEQVLQFKSTPLNAVQILHTGLLLILCVTFDCMFYSHSYRFRLLDLQYKRWN